MSLAASQDDAVRSRPSTPIGLGGRLLFGPDQRQQGLDLVQV
jgi:hypothetical protein